MNQIMNGLFAAICMVVLAPLVIPMAAYAARLFAFMFNLLAV